MTENKIRLFVFGCIGVLVAVVAVLGMEVQKVRSIPVPPTHTIVATKQECFVVQGKVCIFATDGTKNIEVRVTGNTIAVYKQANTADGYELAFKNVSTATVKLGYEGPTRGSSFGQVTGGVNQAGVMVKSNDLSFELSDATRDAMQIVPGGTIVLSRNVVSYSTGQETRPVLSFSLD